VNGLGALFSLAPDYKLFFKPGFFGGDGLLAMRDHIDRPISRGEPAIYPIQLSTLHGVLLARAILYRAAPACTTANAPHFAGHLAPPLRNQWFADSPLEETGFELSVPRPC